MLVTFFDSETTDVVQRHLPLHDPTQPHIVSLTAVQMDLTGRVFNTFGIIVKPDGFVISDRVAEHHGITQELAMQAGLPITTVLSLFNHFLYRSNLDVAFNADFDKQMVEIESMRVGMDTYLIPEKLQCAMLPCADIMKIPNPRGFGGWKWPTLQEAHQHFFGEGFEGAHSDRLADTFALSRVWFELVRRQIVPFPGSPAT